MSSNIRKQIEEMDKKTVQHIHLDGSVRRVTIQNELGKEITDEQLGVGAECASLKDYLEKFAIPGRAMQTKEQLKQITYELYEDLAKQNVGYAEVRFAPSKHREHGLEYDEIVQAAIDGMKEAEKKYGIKGCLILCAMREASKEENLSTVKVAKEFLGKGVGAIDLAGGEANFPTKNFEDIFVKAKKEGVPFTIHAGEADGIYSMKDAIDFGAKRIGHGVAIANYYNCMDRLQKVKTLQDLMKITELQQYSEVRKLMAFRSNADISSEIKKIIGTFNYVVEEVKRKNIGLEVCPKSNYDTKAFGPDSKLEDYYKAAELLYKKGFIITINPDNSTVSSIDVNTELENLVKYTDLTLDDVAKIQMNGIDQSFLYSKKEKDCKSLDKN